jgi:hypothetical protein
VSKNLAILLSALRGLPRRRGFQQQRKNLPERDWTFLPKQEGADSLKSYETARSCWKDGEEILFCFEEPASAALRCAVLSFTSQTEILT